MRFTLLASGGAPLLDAEDRREMLVTKLLLNNAFFVGGEAYLA